MNRCEFDLPMGKKGNPCPLPADVPPTKRSTRSKQRHHVLGQHGPKARGHGAVLDIASVADVALCVMHRFCGKA
jgi:hypothetical protein